MANSCRNAQAAKKITPGKRSPTIQGLADGGYAISALVLKKQVNVAQEPCHIN